MLDTDSITVPTLILNESLAREHIRKLSQKAKEQNIRFRPHFKTHQSTTIAEWFREEGVTAITCSSLRMAEYFAAAGWADILVAFPINIREIKRINKLAKAIHLEILLADPSILGELDKSLETKVDAWVKIDAGYGRAGVSTEKKPEVLDFLQKVTASENLNLKGLLTHAGQTYRTNSASTAIAMHKASTDRMLLLKDYLSKKGYPDLQISVGDTPGCWLSDQLGGVDEIRPGNFVFFDCHQVEIGTCQAQDIAVALACPIVAVQPEQEKVIVYGGTIHLSSERVSLDGNITFGLPVLLTSEGWGAPIPGAYVPSLSQEHGVLHVPRAICATLKAGMLVGILPAHSCITVSCMRQYLTLENQVILAMDHPGSVQKQGNRNKKK